MEQEISFFCRKKLRMSGDKGLSLIELMIAMAVVSIVSLVVMMVYNSFLTGYTNQQVTSDALQKVRSALSYMASEIKHAGLDPADTKKFKVRTAESLRFTYDFDTDPFDGDINSDNTKPSERKTFQFAGGKLQVVENMTVAGAPSVGTQKSAEDLLPSVDMNATVTSPSRFEYLDNDNNPITPLPVAPERIPEICSVRIFLAVKEIAGRSGYVTRAADTTVLCRNLQFKAYK